MQPRLVIRSLLVPCLMFVALLARVGGSIRHLNAAESDAASGVQSLDGEWRIAFDAKDVGKTKGWFKPSTFPLDASQAIQVPGTTYEVDPGYSGVFWYSRTFTPAVSSSPEMRQYLRFGGVTYACEVWLNGTLVGSHEGGQAPFEFDVTGALLAAQPNRLTLRITGPTVVAAPGINHHVSLVAQPPVRIKDVFAKPDIHAGRFELQVTLENQGENPATVALRAAYGEYKPHKDLGVITGEAVVPHGVAVKTLMVPLEHPRLWDLDTPFLYTFQVTSDWSGAASADARQDSYSFRSGLRDFRIVDGWFNLNGKRIYPKSMHGSAFDPMWMYATPRTMQQTYMKEEFAWMKGAGFNMFRFIVSAALPEQLDIADELGFLIYSEHETSWLQKDDTKFGVVLNDLVRRDRNHPSLVLWGLLNETCAGRFYDAAKAWLPSLRAIDDTRLVLLNSGRWDLDFKTGSASNPGSTSWNVYLGGEDPNTPITDGKIPDELTAFKGGAGDIHVYQHYPTTWRFISEFAEVAFRTKPVFLSEAGLGSSYNAIRAARKMRAAGAPDNAPAWGWINKAVEGLQQAWPKYHLETLYPSIEQMLIDSELNAAHQRELMFDIVRSNAKINGYSLTSSLDAGGNAEGVMDVFREFKPGHLPVLQAGWAKLRWCLFVNPMHGYADQPFRVKVALASEDALPAGVYPVTLSITGSQGSVWKKAVNVAVPVGPNPPLAYIVFEKDIALAGLHEDTYTLSAKFDERDNAASRKLLFFVAEESWQPRNLGPITVLGVSRSVRELLVARGATLRDFAADQESDREVIVIGEKVLADSPAAEAATWRSLYARVARGAHAVFLTQLAFQSGKNHNKWLAVGSKGDQTGHDDWLYHKDIVAKPHPFMAGLQTKIMTPDYYGELLAKTDFLWNVTPPDDAVAVAIRDSYAPFDYKDGVMLGTYHHHAGKFTVNTLQVISSLGHPAADRLLLNMVSHARSTAAPNQPLPPNYDAELDSLGISE